MNDNDDVDVDDDDDDGMKAKIDGNIIGSKRKSKSKATRLNDQIKRSRGSIIDSSQTLALNRVSVDQMLSSEQHTGVIYSRLRDLTC